MSQENTRETKPWERRPNETPKQYAAFQVYYQLDPYGEPGNRRTVSAVCEKLKLKSDSRALFWSRQNDWVERAAAYDASMANRSIEIRETELVEYQQAVIASLSTQLVMLNQIIEKSMKTIHDNIDEGKVDLAAVKRLAEVIRVKDDLARRVGHMPTQYTSDQADDDDDFGERTYVIGG